MKHRLSSILSGVLILLRAGCGGMPSREFDSSSNSHIKKSSTVTQIEPNQYEVGIVNHPGGYAGHIGPTSEHSYLNMNDLVQKAEKGLGTAARTVGVLIGNKLR